MYLSVLIYTIWATLFFLFMMLLQFKGPDSAHKACATFYPSVLVIVPCKGMDLTLMDNLLSIKDQEYGGRHDLLAVVDDRDDHSVPIIERAGIKYIVSEHHDQGSGKVRAISTAIRLYQEYEVYVIADSDALVDRHWLGTLVSPLADKRVGVSTTFPYFNPKGGFWSLTKMAWGFIGYSLMRSKLTRFGWGGSIAFRRDLLDDISFKRFSTAIVDDITLTNIAKEKGLMIYYTESCSPIINSDDDFKKFFEWSNRQTAVLTTQIPVLPLLGVVYEIFYVALLYSSIIATVTISPYFLVLITPFLLGFYGLLKRSAKKTPKLVLVYLIMPYIYIINLIVGSRMKAITWRNVTYPIRD